MGRGLPRLEQQGLVDDRSLAFIQRSHKGVVQMQVLLHQRRRGQRQPLIERQIRIVIAFEQL